RAPTRRLTAVTFGTQHPIFLAIDHTSHMGGPAIRISQEVTPTYFEYTFVRGQPEIVSSVIHHLVHNIVKHSLSDAERDHTAVAQQFQSARRSGHPEIAFCVLIESADHVIGKLCLRCEVGYSAATNEIETMPGPHP